MEGRQQGEGSSSKIAEVAATVLGIAVVQARHIDWRVAWGLVPRPFKRTPVVLGALAVGMGVSWLMNRKDGAST